MKKSGIYCIENLKNEKKYIGQSIDLENRKYEHFLALKENYHFNRHLQSSYNKYGEENFKFRILLYCEPFELTKYEQIFVDYYTPKLLYNVRLECVDSNQGITFSKETRKKMSQNHSDVSGKNNHNYGKHHSKETKRKMSEANSGKNNYNYGKHLFKETKRKISKAQSGKNNHNYGKHPSEETIRKMSEAKRGENCYNSKLTKKQVFEILDLYYNKNKTQTDISKMFPVNNVAIFRIVRGKRWKSCYKEFMENNKK